MDIPPSLRNSDQQQPQVTEPNHFKEEQYHPSMSKMSPYLSFEDMVQPIDIHDDGVQAVSLGAMARVQRTQDQLTHTSYNNNKQAPSMGLVVGDRGVSQPVGVYFSYNEPPSHTDVARHHKSHKGLLGSSFTDLLSFVSSIIRRRNKINPSSKNKSPNFEEENLLCDTSVFSYLELKDATNNFSLSHELGEGGFGVVYYDMREVAVKRLYVENRKGTHQFINKVEILTRLRHPNLVVFYGCTSQKSREFFLVFEYIPNGTIADHLYGKQAVPGRLTWPILLKIAIETARALVSMPVIVTCQNN